MISTVILKPTRLCNADCSYCSSPPEGSDQWTVNDFETIMSRIAPLLTDQATIIWHGGEPMMMGVQFYEECHRFAKTLIPDIRFAMQTNLTLYKSSVWKDLFANVFEGRVSTSYDPDELSRTIKGSTKRYNEIFQNKLNEMIKDGFSPLVVGTYTEESIALAHAVYDDSISRGTHWYDFRVNHRYPAGRAMGSGELINPISYGKVLIELYERWIKDTPDFVITPLDQMLKLSLGLSGGQCPWTRRCGGRFLSIEPNGDVYNCADFADLDDKTYRYGNIFTGLVGHGNGMNFYRKPSASENTVSQLMSSHAAKLMRKRVYDVPVDCISCEHFKECEGGCMREAVLFERGLGGKYYYCESWKMVFTRIKESIQTGEVSGLISKWGYDFPALQQRYMRQ